MGQLIPFQKELDMTLHARSNICICGSIHIWDGEIPLGITSCKACGQEDVELGAGGFCRSCWFAYQVIKEEYERDYSVQDGTRSSDETGSSSNNCPGFR